MRSDNENACLLVADHEDALAGFIFFQAEKEFLEADPDQIYVQDVIVTAGMRRMGVGRSLMEHVRQFMAERGIRRIDLQVLSGNEEASTFYSALGFETAYVGLKAEILDAEKG